ncbi:histidine kinase [Stanieria sp. NIES-3757]|nr:histidine kinase [Stanieria sp. NIES-3757]
MKLWQKSPVEQVVNYFLLLALITVGVVGGVAYFRARQALQQSAFNRLSAAANLKEAEITRWFEDQQRDFLLTTQLPEVQKNFKILLNDSVAKEQYLNAYQEISRYLIEVVKIKPNLQEIYILDRSNKILLSTNPRREGEYEILANITYVEEVKLGDNFSPIFYVSPFTGKPAITLAKPIRNQQQQRQGMLLINLNLERIDRIVRERTGLGDSGETYLVGSLVSKNTFISRDTQSERDFPDGISSPGIDAAMSGMSGYGTYNNYANSPVLGVYRWLNDQDLALLVEISIDEAYTPARQLASTIILVGLISVLGLSVGVNWLSRQLTLSRQQLEIKAKEAETANHAKSLFLANMSHELRTPLNAILGFAQLMERDERLTSSQQESLAIINRSGEHLLNLINDVLEMSKIEAGRIMVNQESFDLHQLLQTIREMFQFRAESKQLSFNFVLAPDVPQYIVSDCRKLRQVLINLLSNAIKFTAQGGVTLRVTSVMAPASLTVESEKQPITIYFEVTDTGKGIAPEELQHLFQPFVQTATGIETEGGTGLGLSISSQFVELMGGKIEAKSKVGEGSTFSFQIQATLSNASVLKSQSEVKIEHIAPNQPDYRILVVDDQEANCQLLAKLLQTVGFQTQIANNGQEAIAIWQAWQPHLIWMDMRMPIMDGYTATEKIKQYPDCNTIIIALTASAFEEQRAKILTAGCDDFVRKPFQETIIFEKIAQHLGVKYIYQEETRLDSTSLVATEDLSFMSAQWIEQLQQAAIAVDADSLTELISQIPATHHPLALQLTELVDNYDFDAIIDLTDKTVPITHPTK